MKDCISTLDFMFEGFFKTNYEKVRTLFDWYFFAVGQNGILLNAQCLQSKRLNQAKIIIFLILDMHVRNKTSGILFLYLAQLVNAHHKKLLY